ncbi:CGNR zinc finger domain-containing protein [Clostridium prolinivorans]|uniref:CGNR zinc finger domain-containing protein n=1 Tax=Clostridium prolinivorans TaxID=2769420 RepID=UPI000FDA182D|nr:CGNR zinc finger domain-containing protein [Clostridium prolinivorans]
MSQNANNFFENNLFRFQSCACDCVEDIIHTAPGHPEKRILKLQAILEDTIHFAFAAGDIGLVRLGTKGALIEKNVLGNLISIKNGDTSALFNFFKRNGFFFNISSTEYEEIDGILLFELISRIRATVELMSALTAIRRDYDKILHLTLYLLLSEPIVLDLPSLKTPYMTCVHPFLEKIKNASNLLVVDRGQESFDKYTYSISDTIYSPIYELDINNYNDIISGHMNSKIGSDNPFFKNLTLLYCNAINEDLPLRETIDFLFHYQYNVGIIKAIDYENGIDYFTAPNKDKFDKLLKDALIRVAHIVLGEEINANLDGIHPQYDAIKMYPSWNIDNLMAALYFSIFYMTQSELYRRCANPNCGVYFLVRTTSTRKKYCSDECRNRFQQHKYRQRKRSKQERHE